MTPIIDDANGPNLPNMTEHQKRSFFTKIYHFFAFFDHFREFWTITQGENFNDFISTFFEFFHYFYRKFIKIIKKKTRKSSKGPKKRIAAYSQIPTIKLNKEPVWAQRKVCTGKRGGTKLNKLQKPLSCKKS